LKFSDVPVATVELRRRFPGVLPWYGRHTHHRAARPCCRGWISEPSIIGMSQNLVAVAQVPSKA
jgi:hypothetical protein